MKSIYWIAGISLSLTAIGCQSWQLSLVERSTSFSAEETSSSESADPRAAEADALMSKVVDAINRGDAKFLSQYLRYGDEVNQAFARAAIADYRTYFNPRAIERFERVGEAPYNPEALQYKLYNRAGVNKEIFVSFQSNSVTLYDEFLTYSARAKNLLDGLIAAVQQQNARKLAAVLTPDDIDYPVSLAEQAIANYEEKLEPQTLNYSFIGLEDRRDRFIYEIAGTQNGKPIQHRVKIVYGDGLVGLEDEWIPPNSIR